MHICLGWKYKFNLLLSKNLIGLAETVQVNLKKEKSHASEKKMH